MFTKAPYVTAHQGLGNEKEKCSSKVSPKLEWQKGNLDEIEINDRSKKARMWLISSKYFYVTWNVSNCEIKKRRHWKWLCDSPNIQLTLHTSPVDISVHKWKLFLLFFLEKKLCVISMEIRITLFRTCFGFLLPSIGLDFGDGSDSRKAFARCCSTKRFQIWIEWINNAETMRTWHFSSPFSNCDWKKNEKVSRSKLSYFFRDCLLRVKQKKKGFIGEEREFY